MFRIEKIYQGWTLERIARHIFYWLAWLLFYAIINSSYHDDPIMNWVEIELIFMIIKLPFTYFVIYYLVPQFLIKKQYPLFFIIGSIFAAIGGLGVWLVDFYIITPSYFGKYPSQLWNFKIAYKMLDLVYIASLPTILKLLQSHIHQERLTLQVSEQKLGAELKLLKNQLQPHFLFNTLNNLYGMVLTGHEKAAEVVVRLSDMMSYMLYECEGNTIPLEKEVNNLENYIELEKIRYGKRLEVSFEKSGDISNKIIAPLLFIPFVENAFKHGVGNSEQHSWVRINLWVEKDQLFFLIENSITENQEEEELSSKTQKGIGLANVQKRLELLYPGEHQLELKREDTFLVQLNLKLNELYHRG